MLYNPRQCFITFLNHRFLGLKVSNTRHPLILCYHFKGQNRTPSTFCGLPTNEFSRTRSQVFQCPVRRHEGRRKKKRHREKARKFEGEHINETFKNCLTSQLSIYLPRNLLLCYKQELIYRGKFSILMQETTRTLPQGVNTMWKK